MSLEEGDYRPPPRHACDPPNEYAIELSDVDEPGEHRIFMREVVYKRRLVDYSIEHQVRETPDGDWLPVFRIDTSHGSIHWHQLHRDGTERKAVLTVLGRFDGDILDGSWSSSYEEVLDKAEQHFRSWSR
ncbi:hypothetical protein [Actinomyces radicidentis]|uniref:DUF7718 family protein n=1 Tax=Actinomyces radicidentis TaxID=111015 RepID=UPI0028E859F3|nr:hypothetical protein [Actinomyces radicidentis]